MESIAIIGGGGETEALLTVLAAESRLKIIGITGVSPGSEAYSAALEKNIPIIPNYRDLLDMRPDIAIVVSGEHELTADIVEHKFQKTGIICGKSTRFILDLLEKRQKAKEDIKCLLNDARDLYRIGISLTSSDHIEDVLDTLLLEALRGIKAPAGSIALYDAQTEMLTLKTSHGFSPQFSQVRQWKRREGGMTDHILGKKVPTVMDDISMFPFVDNAVLIAEGIKSLVCVPLIAGENIIGIIYTDDFSPRKWSPREVEFLTLLGIQAAYAIEKFNLLKTVTDTRSYLQSVLDNSADIIMTTDMTGRIVEFNSGAVRELGYTREEACGTPAAGLWVDPGERSEVLKLMDHKGHVSNYETCLKTRDGRIMDVSLTLSYIVNDNGDRVGTVGISKDITENKKLAAAVEEKSLELLELNEKLEEKVLERTRELEKANWELDRSNRLKSQFIATMSHELRTPLNSILGFSELLLDEVFGPLTEKQKRYASNIYNSGSHLLQLINNILDIAKIESGKMELHYEGFSVSQAISEVQTVIKPLADKKAQSLTIGMDGKAELIKADKVKFKQILYNLLSNSVKFTPEGGSIVISAEMLDEGSTAHYGEKAFICRGVDGCLKISVTDTGIGINKEDQERIFSEFEQVDSSYSRKYEGTGLGLALTKRLVELHGGEIIVSSEPGKGSTFTVIIPPFDLSEAQSDMKELALKEIGPDGDLCPDLLPRGRRGESPLILVAEDDPSTLEILTLYLTKGGYRVAHAHVGGDVVPRIRELQPFAVVLDIMLPGKDGWEILQEVKSDPELKDIPVIIASIIDNKELGFALGASDYLVKPVDRHVLLDRIREMNMGRAGTTTNILCIDDNSEALELLSSILGPSGYNVITAVSGREGIEKAVSHKPGLVILDLMMPEMDGFEVVGALKNNPVTADIPILILTAKDLTLDDRLRLAGKVESFVRKSCFTKDDLLMHIKDLEVTYPRRAGLLDEVSGLFDHSYFQIRLAQETARSARYKDTFTLVMIDLDNFTEYIRAHGIHRANICIRKVAEFLRKSLRGSDTVVRYGIDEFGVILSRTSRDASELVSRRFLSYIESYPFYGENIMPQGRITATIALVSCPMDATAPEELVDISHQMLRKAKAEGGGRLVLND